jgi:probable rRNA maturation factor
MPQVTFQYADISRVSLSQKKKVKELVEQIFLQEGKQLGHISYIFCSDEYLLQINRQFLNHDDFTDIITFDLSVGEEIVGEIYISAERVTENAALHRASKGEEFRRVIFHGALHLCGYRDKKIREITIMRHKEDYYLRLFEKQYH